MVWVRLDDSFPDHRKIAELGDYAPLCGWLFICGLAYCNRQLTDGLIPKGHVVRLSSFRRLSIETGGVPGLFSAGDDIDADTLALLLESVGLWEDRETHWYIHDYPDYQPTKAEVEAERASKQAAGRAGGQASAQARAERRAQAPAQAPAQAKSNPVPVPVPVPLTSDEVSSLGARAPRLLKPRFEPLTAIERGELLTKWLARLPDANELIDLALEHDAHLKYPTGQKRYVDNWLKNSLGRRNGNGNGSAITRRDSFPQLTRAANATGPGRAPDLVG